MWCLPLPPQTQPEPQPAKILQSDLCRLTNSTCPPHATVLSGLPLPLPSGFPLLSLPLALPLPSHVVLAQVGSRVKLLGFKPTYTYVGP